MQQSKIRAKVLVDYITVNYIALLHPRKNIMHNSRKWLYPLVIINMATENGPVKIVSFLIANWGFLSYVNVYQKRNPIKNPIEPS